MNVRSPRNWSEILRHRREVLRALVQAKKHAVYAGDRPVVQFLDGSISRQRERCRYAANMERKTGRVVTLVNAPFAAPDNRPDNARSARGD